MKRVVEPKMLYFGTPVVLISSENPDGSTNIAPMSSVWWMGTTAVLGMSVQSQTVRNLLARPRCVLNLVPGGAADAIDRLALLTGRADVPAYKAARGYEYQPDKFVAAGLTAVDMPGGGPQGVGECPIQLQASVREVREIDGPDSGLRALEAAVGTVHVDDAVMLAGRPDHFDALAWDPLIMKFTEYFAGGVAVRESSLARGWQLPALTLDGSGAVGAAA